MSISTKTKQNFYRCLIVSYLMIWLLLLTTPVNAQPSPQPTASVDTLRQMQEQIDQQRSNLRKERDRLSTAQQAILGQIGGTKLNIQSTETAQKDYESQLQLANKHLKQIEISLAQAQQNYYQKQSATVARLRFLQRQKITGFGWDILLKSQNLNELLDRRRQVKLIYQADQQSLINLRGQAQQIKQQKAEIELQKNQIALLTQQLLAQKSQFQAQLTSQQQLIERLKTDKQALEAAQAQLAADSRSIGILIQRQVAATNKAILPNGIFGTGQLTYPSEAEITSSFGWRIHPILGYSRFHSGLDFGADYGSTIRAAGSGVVLFAGWYGGYGNAVVINHSQGISTLYGHNSKLYVAEGQTVQQGEVIADAGSTGLSTGPHLHFEVRKDGEPVDPMNYL